MSDLISREAAIKAISNIDRSSNFPAAAITALHNIPSTSVMGDLFSREELEIIDSIKKMGVFRTNHFNHDVERVVWKLIECNERSS